MKDKKEEAADFRAIILDSISDGVFTVDGDWKITSFNAAAEEITGIAREEAMGMRCSDVFKASMCESACALRETMETGEPVIDRQCFIIDWSGQKIPISVSTAVLKDEDGNILGGAETFRDLSEIEVLRMELKGRRDNGSIIAESPAMKRIMDTLPLIAASHSTVLISGDSGTGKEIIARYIHALSKSAEGPFMAINCGAIPENLLESELFGYKKGAFTGAEKDRDGLFKAAAGGTVFLDEIGELPLPLQVKLLRVIQERTFTPLGSTKQEQAAIRILAATNRDLEEEVRKGGFREDLFYRINVIHITLPPLRDRKTDIPSLADHIIARLNTVQGRRVKGVTSEVLSAFMDYHWPGNIRELENVIERAFVLCGDGEIDVCHMPEYLAVSRAAGHPGLKRSKDVFERQSILRALRENGWNRKAAAEALGMHKSTLYRKIQRLNIELPETDGRHS